MSNKMLTFKEGRKMIDKAVAGGVKKLNQTIPGWRRLVQDAVNRLRLEEDEEFEMDNTQRCTLACIFGDYDRGVEALGLSDRQSSKLGFQLDDFYWNTTLDVNEKLQNYWNEKWLKAARIR